VYNKPEPKNSNTSSSLTEGLCGKERQEMIEDKATEKWKERAKKLGLIVNMGADKPDTKRKAGDTDGKAKPARRIRSEEPPGSTVKLRQ
jgi:hypothetical protein